MKTRVRPLGVVIIVCVLLFGCSSGSIDLSGESGIQETPVPTGQELEGWHRVDKLGLSFYASDDWAEEESLLDPGYKSVDYPLSNGQYYQVTVYEMASETVDLQTAAEMVAEDLTQVESGMSITNTQIQTKDWTNGNHEGKLISYTTRYDKDYYQGYMEGYKDIIQNDTSQGKILVILEKGKMYKFCITVYQNEESAFGTFDRLTGSIGLE